MGDLGVLPEFDYWSCDDKESGTDVTGKTINLEKPDGDDINFIDGDYECDQYIDCQNMSDEGYQCTPSFTVAFVVVGILTGILILGTKASHATSPTNKDNGPVQEVACKGRT